jgi:hypothetical protein
LPWTSHKRTLQIYISPSTYIYAVASRIALFWREKSVKKREKNEESEKSRQAAARYARLVLEQTLITGG